MSVLFKCQIRFFMLCDFGSCLNPINWTIFFIILISWLLNKWRNRNWKRLSLTVNSVISMARMSQLIKAKNGIVRYTKCWFHFTEPRQKQRKLSNFYSSDYLTDERHCTMDDAHSISSIREQIAVEYKKCLSSEMLLINAELNSSLRFEFIARLKKCV